jgi:hypothetical protein
VPPKYQPLSSDQLRAIYEVSPTPAVRRLLWEIHRLRATILAADQLNQRLIETGAAARLDTTTQLLVGSLHERLKDEPVVRERHISTAETLHLMEQGKRPR